MPLETSTYINGLTASWPIAADPKSQGDDHLRLIKSVLQATFPTATQPFYFPSANSQVALLTAAMQNSSQFYDTTAGNISVTLPTFTVGQNAGWSCEIIKTTGDGNAAVVAASSGNIFSTFGATATIRVGAAYSTARFIWIGNAWVCCKQGPLIGSTVNFDGPSIPAGYLVLDGSGYSTTTFAELALALGGATLRDKRGRVEAGVDGGVGRLTATYFGATAVNGAVGGVEGHTLATADIPAVGFSGTSGVDSPDHTHGYAFYNTTTFGIQGGGTFSWNFGTSTVNTSGASARHQHGFSGNINGGGGTHRNVQHTIVTNKIIRAC